MLITASIVRQSGTSGTETASAATASRIIQASISREQGTVGGDTILIGSRMRIVALVDGGAIEVKDGSDNWIRQVAWEEA